MAETKTQTGRITDWLIYDENGVGSYSRENVVQAAGQSITTGSVLAYDESGNIVAFTGATGVANEAVGIAVNDVVTIAGAGINAIVARQARVSPSGLVFGGAITAPQKAAAMASLAKLGIVVANEA
jgi:hypothetical protein